MRNDRELSQSLLEDEHPSEHTHNWIPSHTINKNRWN
jgi:hypothetical protein